MIPADLTQKIVSPPSLASHPFALVYLFPTYHPLHYRVYIHLNMSTKCRCTIEVLIVTQSLTSEKKLRCVINVITLHYLPPPKNFIRHIHKNQQQFQHNFSVFSQYYPLSIAIRQSLRTFHNWSDIKCLSSLLTIYH